ncbi:MAG: transposase, partial [Proteobacteria bacterium]|nr:transposase [Pseudomonadota bacterium]
AMFSEKRNQARKLYLEFMEEQESEEIAAFYSKKNLSSILGGEGFKDWLRENFQELRFKQDVPKSKELALGGHVIRKLVCKEFKVKNDVLMLSRRGTENLSRDVAIFLQRKYCGQTLAELGRDYNIASYSSVSSAFERAKSRLVTDQQLKEKVSRIETKLNKGQRKT